MHMNTKGNSCAEYNIVLPFLMLSHYLSTLMFVNESHYETNVFICSCIAMEKEFIISAFDKHLTGEGGGGDWYTKWTKSTINW